MRNTKLRFFNYFIVIGALSLAGSPACKKAPPPPPPAKGTGGGSGQAGGFTKNKGISGKVVETMDAGGYTYVRLQTGRGEVWAAVRKVALTKGQVVTVVRFSPMKNFRSKSLKRTFPVIYFGQLGRPGQAGMGPHMGMRGPNVMGKKGHPKRGGGKRAVFAKPLTKAPGANGRTVAEVYAQRKALTGKTAVVHGKVVKFSKKIMGKNWIHLQDGSGKIDDFDLTVTTQAVAKVGDMVVVEGTVKADVNIGAGYRYKVMIIKATVTPAAAPATPGNKAPAKKGKSAK